MGYTITPRGYQYDAVAAFFEYWRNATGSPVVAMPTGTGKSVVVAEFCRQALTQWPDTRVLVVTHVKELVEQNFLKLLQLWPQASAGIYSAGLRRKDTHQQVIFAGIGSVAKVARKFRPDVILIDECHSVSDKEATSYRKFLAECLRINPLVKVGGLTATPFRLGQGMIVEPGGIFTDIAIDMTGRDAFNWFLSEGYLAPLIPAPVKTEMDISGVRVNNTGDYNLKELQAAVDKDAITRAAVEEIIRLGEGREHWLIFAAGVQHANHIANILAEMGISAGVVHSNTKDFPMTDGKRDAVIESFTTGEIKALVNNGVLTTGFDFPGIDLIAVLRHTTSPGLWVQMLGRGTRPLWFPGHGFDLDTREGRLACIAAGKANCLVLDFARNAERLGPVNDPKKPQPRRKKDDDTPGDCPAKTCPACWAYNHASARKCVDCGEEFKFLLKIYEEAGTASLIAANAIAEEPRQEWFNVQTVTYSKHTAWNGRKVSYMNRPPASLRVCYHCDGVRPFFEHVNLEHDGAAGAMAGQWWNETCPGTEPPQTIDEALQLCDNLRQPEKIRVWINRPKPKVMYREFLTLSPA